MYLLQQSVQVEAGEVGRGQVTKGCEHSIREFGLYPVGTEVFFGNIF